MRKSSPSHIYELVRSKRLAIPLTLLLSATLVWPITPTESAQKPSEPQKSKDPKESSQKESKTDPKKDSGTTPAGTKGVGTGDPRTPLGRDLSGDKGLRRALNVRAGLDERTLSPSVRDLVRSGTPRRYYIYNFRKAGARVQLDARAWNGLLAIRTPSARPTRATFRLLDRRGRAVALGRRRLISGWYKNPDGTISKLLLNGRNQPIGNLTMDRSGNKTLALDRNGDLVAEFVAVHDRTGRLQILAEEAEGLRLYRELLDGSASLCDARSSADPVAPDPRYNFLCQSRSVGGKTAGDSGRRTPSADALDPLCASLLTKPDSPIPRYGDDEDDTYLTEAIIIGGIAILSAPVALFILIVTWPSHAGETDPPTTPVEDVPVSENEMTLDEVESTAGGDPPPNTVYIEDAFVIESDDSRSGRSGSGSSTRERTGVDTAGKGIDAFREVCKGRRALATKWRFLDIRESSSCDNPYRVPVPGPADQPMGRLNACTDPDEPYIDPERMVREGRSGNCGPFAQPGADGRCHGRGMFFNSSRGGRGSYAFAAGGVYGVQPCDPRFCDPPPGR